MRLKINVFDESSLNDAIIAINNYKKTLQLKANEIASRLAVLGAQVVEYSYYANELEDYEVSCIVNGNSSMIIAEGDGVIFLEFGTGVFTEDHTGEMETSGLPEIRPGSWSETEGLKMFARYGYWFHEGRKYIGTPPKRGFYFASKEIKEQAVDIAKKVFRQ